MDNNYTSLFAALPDKTRRNIKIEEHEYRDAFQRDRDRILYSKEYRRLSGKTQVFVVGYDDNIRTRLTHTLEVAQISNTIANALGLNSMLTEAIASAHDVGHTPFGHIGERTLNHIMNGCIKCKGCNNNLKNSDKGFKHNLQGLRVVSELERYDGNKGLNLTRYTLWGIANHTKLKYGDNCDYRNVSDDKKPTKCNYINYKKDCHGLSVGFYDSLLEGENALFNENDDWTLEGIIVAAADEIAQRHHDIEDGIYAGILDYRELFKKIMRAFKGTSLEDGIKDLQNKEDELGVDEIIQNLSKCLVDYYVTEYIDFLRRHINNVASQMNINSSDDFYNNKSDVCKQLIASANKSKMKKNRKDTISEALSLSFAIKEDKEFGSYLCDSILLSELAQKMDGKASFIIIRLFKAYLTNPQQLPDATIVSIVKELNPTIIHNKYSDSVRVSKARKELKKLLSENKKETVTVLLRKICDFVAGMTDSYATQQYRELYETV